MRVRVLVDSIRESPQPAPEAPACLLDERPSSRRAVVEAAHREVRFQLGWPEVPGRLAASLKIATADFRRVVFSHRVPEGEPCSLLVVGQNMRDAETVAPDLDALCRGPLALQRGAAPEE